MKATREAASAGLVRKRQTHEALITDEEAEAILARLSASKRAEKRRTPANYLLTGLLQTSSGASWYGDGSKQYRTKPSEGRGRYVAKDLVEDPVIGNVLEDMQSPAFIHQLTAETRRYAASQPEDPAQELRKQLKDVTQRVSRAMDFASALSDPGPALRKIEELERQRKLLAEEIARLGKKHGLTTA